MWRAVSNCVEKGEKYGTLLTFGNIKCIKN